MKLLIAYIFLGILANGYFLRNDFSWHSVEPVDVAPNYIRKSLNISFIYKN